MALKGFSCKEWRLALKDEEEEEEILQPLTINEEEECLWHVFTEEIFPRLPVKQLQKLKSVCKNWNRIISSPYFVELHLKIYNNQSRIRVLLPRNARMMIEYTNYNYDTKKIRYPPSTSMYTTILGSCDGLLCLHFGGGFREFSVYNPSTRKYLWVELRLKDNYKINCSWFGHRPSSGEYVLVLGDFQREVGVYKFINRRSKSNLKKIHSTSCCINPQDFSGFFENRVGTLLHGAVHWPVERDIRRCGSPSRHVICAYHLDDNKRLEISPPLQRAFKLGVAEGCLFAFFKAKNAQGCEYEMWIMKEYGVQQSWIKYANIEGFNNSFRVLYPLGFFPNGNIILYPNNLGVVNYTFKDNKALLLMDDDYDLYGNYEAIMCADSLMLPQIVGT